MGRVVVRWVRVFSGWGRYLLGGCGTSWVGPVPPGWACHVRLEHRFADIGWNFGWGWEFSHGPLLNPRRESSRGGFRGALGAAIKGSVRHHSGAVPCLSVPFRAGPCWTVLDRAGPCWTMSDLWGDCGVMVGVVG